MDINIFKEIFSLCIFEVHFTNITKIDELVTFVKNPECN